MGKLTGKTIDKIYEVNPKLGTAVEWYINPDGKIMGEAYGNTKEGLKRIKYWTSEEYPFRADKILATEKLTQLKNILGRITAY